MPTLDWIGKQSVVNHHRKVPTRLLHCNSDLSFGDRDAGNLLIQGDNLEALKALLPYYAGKVKCIYIDPPYNTGSEGWIYNDNVNSPEMRTWLGAVVGKEADDLSRHDKWLCMMYPRLKLLKEFLCKEGSIWISIDDNEAQYLAVICDEIFGRRNFLANIIWQKRYSPDSRVAISDAHEHLICYASNSELFKIARNLLPLEQRQIKQFRNPDNDLRGPWKANDFTAAGFRPNQMYEIRLPSGRVVTPPKGRCWRVTREGFEAFSSDGRMYYGPDGDGLPSLKRFLSDMEGMIPWTWWPHLEVGHSQEAKKESHVLFGADMAFATPKPERLIQRVIQIASNPGELVMDSFAGSGTTGAVAQKLGRKHISIEMGNHACTHIMPRYQRVIEGESGGISELVGWQGGGGFRYCTLGTELFDEWGAINEGVSFSDLAAFTYFSDTGNPIPSRAVEGAPLIGTFENRAIYLLFTPGHEGVASAQAGNVLNVELLEGLAPPAPDWTGLRVVYGEGCTVPPDRLAAENVVFKQIPYQIAGA